jgi:uncharacterized membrane protein
MNSKFPVLSTISGLLRIIGLGSIVCVIVYDAVNLSSITGNGVAMSVAVIVLALVVTAIGESIGVLFAIEENTRKVKHDSEAK